MEEDKLLIGRAALAKEVGSGWFIEYRKFILGGVGVLMLLLIGVLQSLGGVGGPSRSAKAESIHAMKTVGKSLSPYYTKFTENSLLISKEKWKEALRRAQQLKKEMDTDTSFWESRDPLVHSGHVLYAYNLLRIASLERALGRKERELQAWDDLVSYASSPQETKREAYFLLSQSFQTEGVSLEDFIQQRRQLLHKP